MSVRDWPVAARFWLYVPAGLSDDQCWPWQGYRDAKGYGRVTIGGMPWNAARVAYLLERGPIPVGLGVLHSCDRRECVNPCHLRPGTNDENVADRVERGRTVTVSPLADEDVRAIRAARRAGARCIDLAERYGVHNATVSRVARGVTRRAA